MIENDLHCSRDRNGEDQAHRTPDRAPHKQADRHDERIEMQALSDDFRKKYVNREYSDLTRRDWGVQPGIEIQQDNNDAVDLVIERSIRPYSHRIPSAIGIFDIELLYLERINNTRDRAF